MREEIITDRFAASEVDTLQLEAYTECLSKVRIGKLFLIHECTLIDQKLLFACKYWVIEALASDLGQAVEAQVCYREALARKCLEPFISYLLGERNIKEGEGLVWNICDCSEGLVIYRIVATAGLNGLDCLTAGFQELEHTFLADEWTV